MRCMMAQAFAFALLAATSTAQLIARTSGPINATMPVTSTSGPSGATATSLSPCGVISNMSSSFEKAFPSATSKPFVQPSYALACLESVPLDVERSTAFIDYVMAYLEFESSLAYLKDPPPGYLISGVDIMGGLANVKTKLQAGLYINQWTLEVDVNELINVLPHNGHLVWDIPLIQTFVFSTARSLISISRDGLAVPEVYVNDDLLQQALANGSLTWTPSPIATINGEPITEYLESISLVSSSQQDPDAQYNTLFPSIPFTSQESGDFAEVPTGDSYALNFLSDSTSWTFTNGSSRKTMNQAIFQGSFEGVDSGVALFSKVDLPSKPTISASSGTPTTTTASSASSKKPVPTITGYPYPEQKAYDDLVAGYFLNGSGISDTAVLTILSFEDTADPLGGALEMQRVIQDFLAQCVATGKTKLIVDLSANGGGVVASGYDAFKQLFPTVTPFGGSRFRDTPIFNFLGNVSSQLGTYVYDNSYSTPFQIQANLDENLEPLPDWQAEYGPSDRYNGDNFTSLLRLNVSDPEETFGLVVTGSGNRTKTAPQPFKAENIVMLYDGYCASTCTIFSDIMKRQGGVRSIVVGGRPQALPMQGQGGVKGSSIIPSLLWQTTYQEFLSGQHQSPLSNVTYPLPIPFLPTVDPPLGPPLGQDHPSTNARNAYAADDPNGLPLQFVYEAANCRLFYTFADTIDITHLWKRVAAVAWANGTCVPGSTVTADNSFPPRANDTVPFSANVISKAMLPRGAGAASDTGPPSGVSSTLTRVSPSATTSKPAIFTGGAAAGGLAAHTAIVVGGVVGCLVWGGAFL